MGENQLITFLFSCSTHTVKRAEVMPSNRWRPWSQADVALLRRVVNQNPQATNSQTTDLFNAHAQQPRSSSGVSNKVIELELRGESIAMQTASCGR